MRNDRFMYFLYQELHRDPGWCLLTAKVLFKSPGSLC